MENMNKDLNNSDDNINEDNFNDPNDIIDYISSLENKERDIFLLINETKKKLKSLNNSLIEDYTKIINKEVNEDIEKKLLDGINSTIEQFNNQCNDFDKFIIKLDKNFDKKQNSLENSKNLVSSLKTSKRELEEDYKQYILKYSSNQTFEFDDNINKLMEENKIINEKLEEKNRIIEKKNKEYQIKEEQYNNLVQNFNELQNKNEENKKELIKIKDENKTLNNNYNQMINNVLEKIQKEEDEKKNNKNNDNFNERPENEKMVIRKIKEKMDLNEQQKKILEMNYEKLIQYVFNLDLENQTLIKNTTNLKEKVTNLETKNEQLKNNLDDEKKNIFILKSENDKMKNKIEELVSESEINKLFRPSNLLNNLRNTSMQKETINNNFRIINNKEKNPFETKKSDNSLNKISISPFNVNNLDNNNKNVNNEMPIEKKNILKNETVLIFTNKKNENSDEEDSKNSLKIENNNILYNNNDDKINNNNDNFIDDRMSMIIKENEKSNLQDILKEEEPEQNEKINRTFNKKNKKKNNIEESNEIKKKLSLTESKIQSFCVEGNNENNIIENNNIENNKDENNENSSNDENESNKTIEDIGEMLINEKDILNTSFDMISLRKKSEILKLLENSDDNSNSYEMFSDFVQHIEKKNKKTKRVLFITCNYIYILKVESIEVLFKFKREHLKKFTISNRNCNMLAFHFSKGNDLVIEIFRRLELLYYFRNLYKSRKFGKLAFKYSDEFNVKLNGKYITISISPSADTIAQNFQNAIKLDYLYKMTAGLFSYNFTEKFVVLTGIGLLYFDNPNKPPKKLIPIIGSEINEVKEKKYGRPFCFEIKCLNKYNVVFATKSKEELNQWLNAFKQMNNSYERKISNLQEKDLEGIDTYLV